MLAVTLSVLLTLVPTALGHGYLKVPPARSSLWREFEQTLPSGVQINYNDNELFCGGRDFLWTNGGKCGVCGDPFNAIQPENEAGGKYASGYISRRYSQGQVIDVEVKLTADHRGWFEFRLCPHNNPTVPITKQCLDQNLLELEDGTTRYTWSGSEPRIHNIRLVLPAHVICSQCVIQWKYNTGNSWGCDALDRCAIGLGEQEQFYGCSDVSISPLGDSSTSTSSTTSVNQPTTSSTVQPSVQTTTLKTTDSTTPTSTGAKCVAVPPYDTVPNMDEWCVIHCPDNCPASHCRCFNPTSTTTLTTLLMSSSTTSKASSSTTSTTSSAKPKKAFTSFKNIQNLGQIVDSYCNICGPDNSCPLNMCTEDTDLPVLTCTGVGSHSTDPNIPGFCTYVCTYNPFLCPKDMCSCTTTE